MSLTKVSTNKQTLSKTTTALQTDISTQDIPPKEIKCTVCLKRMVHVEMRHFDQ